MTLLLAWRKLGHTSSDISAELGITVLKVFLIVLHVEVGGRPSATGVDGL